MSDMSVSDARARLADVVDAARVRPDPVYLTRRGQRVAAVIDAEDLDRLIAAAEDLADIEAVRASRAEIAGGGRRYRGRTSRPTSAWHDLPRRGRRGRRTSAPKARPRGEAADAGSDRAVGRRARPSGAKKLVGGNGEWRVRTGDYRIVYEIHDNVLLVLVVAVGHRREIYRPR